MNMCLLEVAMCEKWRSSHFQLEGGVKSLRTGRGGVKNFRTGGVTDLGKGNFAAGVVGGGVWGQYPIICHDPQEIKSFAKFFSNT